MMRRLFIVLAAAMILLSACAPGGGEASTSAPTTSSAGAEQSAQGTCTFTDSLGNTVELEQPPKRVAALLGSYAETWLLAGGEVVAVTQDAYDERGLELPEDTVNLGANQQPDLEALFAAEPDLVLLTPDLDGQMGLRDSLEAAGIPAAWFKVETFDDYLNMLKICTDLTGRSRPCTRKTGWTFRARSTRPLPPCRRGRPPPCCCCGPIPAGCGPKTATTSPGRS